METGARIGETELKVEKMGNSEKMGNILHSKPLCIPAVCYIPIVYLVWKEGSSGFTEKFLVSNYPSFSRIVPISAPSSFIAHIIPPPLIFLVLFFLNEMHAL